MLQAPTLVGLDPAPDAAGTAPAPAPSAAGRAPADTGTVFPAADDADKSVFHTVAGALRNVSQPVRDLVPGERLNQHEILGPIAAGGMGRVFRARHVYLEHDVAIKTIQGSLDTPLMRERFLREARALAKMNHPNADDLGAGENGGDRDRSP
jgi:hypothetical protein